MFWRRAEFARFVPATLRSRLVTSLVLLVAVVSTVVFLIEYWAVDRLLDRRLDDELVAEAEEWARIHSASGLPGLKIEFDAEVFSYGGERIFCRFFGPDGTLLLASDLKAWNGLPPPPRHFIATGVPGGQQVFLESLRLRQRADEIRTVYRKDDAGNILQFGHSTLDKQILMERFLLLAMLSDIGLIVVVGFFVHFIASRALGGLSEIKSTVVQATSGDFSCRIDAKNEPAEIQALAKAFNHLQDRIESLVRELKAVSVNIAHDLRSPMTRIRGTAESVLRRESSDADRQEALAVVVEESDRLVSIINTMLAIAEADAGTVDYRKGVVDLTALVRAAGELFSEDANAKGVALQVIAPDGPVRVRGDESGLQRTVANLVENAIKFTPAGGSVDLHLIREETHAVVEVRDTGIGIRDVDAPRVFDRFFRGEPSRTTAGNGLGLSYVASIVRAHGGDVSVQSSVGRNTVFRFWLPLAAEPQAVGDGRCD